jgi:hypothetical protein
MKKVTLSVCALLGAAGTAFAFPGPDVIVGDLSGISNYGGLGTYPNRIFAYAVGTTSCNAGDTPLNWISTTNQHPVIAQNIYRYSVVNGAGRFEHIGGGHLKHGFTALQQTLCFSDCQPNPNGTRLGVHCSDPYSSSLNGTQTRLGPRDEVDAYTGFYPYPFTSRGTATSTIINRRLQVLERDIDPALDSQNTNAVYIAEGQYIAPDDATSGNGTNNASWRRILRGGNSTNWTFSVTGSTVRTQPAIYAWTTLESGVTVQVVPVPGEEQYGGRLHVAYKVTPIAGGMYHYEYVVHNLNSHVSAKSFIVNFPSSGSTGCIDIANPEFNDIFYHSGEPWDGTDWPGTKTLTGYQWMGPDFATNPNGNALRWGTAYTFRFDSNRPPVAGTATIGLFRSGGSVSVNIQVPDSCPCVDPDINCDGSVDGFDVMVAEQVVGGDTSNFCGTDPDFNGDGSVDGFDIEYIEARVGGTPC